MSNHDCCGGKKGKAKEDRIGNGEWCVSIRIREDLSFR